MKLRRNVLQPLRILIDHGAMDPGTKLSPIEDQDRDRIAGLRNALNHWVSQSAEQHVAPRPRALLEQYSRHRSTSPLGHLFRVANRIHSSVDSVVILCRGDAAIGAQAIVEACGQPYWNHLSRAERGSKPRIFFVEEQSDNDSIQGLLHMLGAHRPGSANAEQDGWALLVLGHENETDEAMWQLEPLLAALQSSTANDANRFQQRVFAVASPQGPLANRLRAWGSIDRFDAYDEAAHLQCFGLLGLLPAALVGINIMELLAGASWMTDHFGQAPPEENLILRYMLWKLRCAQVGMPSETIRIWNPGLTAWRRWHDALAARDAFAHLPRQSHTMGEVSIVIERPKFDPIGLDPAGNAPDRVRARMERYHQSLKAKGQTVVEIQLAELDELHVGQLMQFMLLVSASSRMKWSGEQDSTCKNFDEGISPETDG